MATVTFTKGGTTITIQAPHYPESPGETYPMLVGRTLGGGHKVADLGDGTDWNEPTLAFDQMSNTDYVALRNFIQDTLVWSTNLCSYADPFAVTHTNLRYMDGLPGFTSSRGNRWSGQVEFSKDKTA